MNTLIINTYAGSLLIGADAIPGAQIIGSYEDSGFGAAIPAANKARFQNLEPGFERIDKLADWPDQDLSETIILAHPPCAAFSQQNQNSSAAKRGVNTEAFECTRKVLRYGMSNNIAAMAIESVPGALAGAWTVYNEMAMNGGYHVYRVMKNSLLFGVPQFRERFWAVLVRKDLAQPTFTWRLTPKITTVATAVDHLLPGTPVHKLAESVEKFVQRLVREHGFDADEVRRFGLVHLENHRRKSFSHLIAARFFPTEDHKSVCKKYVSAFTSGQPSVLAAAGFAPVLLGSSLWIYKNKPLPEEGYKAIMGFPDDYIFPDGAIRHHMRTYLSKGVCPPVATWILDNVRMHLGLASGSMFTKPGGYVKMIQPGRVVSFRPGKQDILDMLAEMHELGTPDTDELLPLRDEEDSLQEGHDGA